MDTEYEAQYGLGLIKAARMYTRGGTGGGITVGVLDSGAQQDHPDLEGAYRWAAGPDEDDVDDVNGHGTGVAGVIAARRNGWGAHGVAYDAKIASYKIDDDNGAVDATRYAEAMRRFAEDRILVANHSWGGLGMETLIAYGINLKEYLAGLPGFIEGAFDYQEEGGVQVWAAGNGKHPTHFLAVDNEAESVSAKAGVPYFRPDLERSWLAVTSVDEDGDHVSLRGDPDDPATWDASRCGRASDWCLAAPGENIYAPDRDGEYATWSGTSFAAPHVSGALAALKSMFPNLDYQELRVRVLETADSTGRYADESIYGQGLLDLDAASSPVGGTLLALGAFDTSAAASTRGAYLTLPRGALERHFAEREVLVLDGFQRAPFYVRADAFTRPSGPRLGLDDLRWERPAHTDRVLDDGTLTRAVSGAGLDARGASDGQFAWGWATGVRTSEGLAGLANVTASHGRHRLSPDAVGVAGGLKLGGGTLYASAAGETDQEGVVTTPAPGVYGWTPETVLGVSFVPDADTGESFGASWASGLKHPMGIGSAGAFTLGDAESLEVGYGRTVHASERWRLGGLDALGTRTKRRRAARSCR